LGRFQLGEHRFVSRLASFGLGTGSLGFGLFALSNRNAVVSTVKVGRTHHAGARPTSGQECRRYSQRGNHRIIL
jgi:hypothetical protein